MHADHREYFKFTGRSRFDKAVNSLLGIVEGISVDGVINASEVELLCLWLDENREVCAFFHNELVPYVEKAVADGVLDDEERETITWLCNELRSTKYFNAVTADIQRLHALMAGITADGAISEIEVRGLSHWLSSHEILKKCWPYDEVESLVVQILSDKRIDASEQKSLRDFCSEFIAVQDNRTVVSPRISDRETFGGLCAVCPEIAFAGSKFCFTGSSSRYTREEFEQLVRQLGGDVVGSISASVDYLIIGAEGNPCWAYACYGRKVEKAVELRKQGARIVLVHEHDFHDAVTDIE